MGDPIQVQIAAAPTPVSQMYARWTLDCVIEVAIAVANDYVKRFRQYSKVVDAQVSDILAGLRSRTGADPVWPNAAQRAAIYTPLIGTSDGTPGNNTTAFQQAAAALRQAAVAYSERTYDTGEPMLRQAFVEAARAFQACLSTLAGGVVDVGNSETQQMFDRCTRILSADDVGRAFGLPAAPRAPWPFDRQLDGNGASLVEEISRTLQPGGVGTVSQQQFITLQQIAASGKLVVERVQANWHADANAAHLNELIAEAYSWATALGRLGK